MTAQRNFVASLVLAVMMAWAVQFAYGQGMRGYNPNTEVSVQGTVEDVKAVYFPGGGGSEQARRPSGPIHLDLKSDSGLFQVDLGPSWFMESKGFKFAKGDQIEVTGSKLQDKNAIIAREVKEGGKVLTLRNAKGTPEWSGRSLQ